jgi:hypothetical protein
MTVVRKWDALTLATRCSSSGGAPAKRVRGLKSRAHVKVEAAASAGFNPLRPSAISPEGEDLGRADTGDEMLPLAAARAVPQFFLRSVDKYFLLTLSPEGGLDCPRFEALESLCPNQSHVNPFIIVSRIARGGLAAA